ncbi:uncharacterized protein SPSK_10059 [Sporothrix schenckii 1099-18]|uniref:Uncharacterized protein n=1 Tax=Sporothrix schenckii 1099-18 TaxID=1397361 RepID=A0A0F2M5W1_SPOSC|nr:uncharacterized protein SPSK_10059 [Sporothrix schenckii 1099-18]KJR85017.1 hypothetical protein SPSK_10059 [Sporothrix schenckii 1099-18]
MSLSNTSSTVSVSLNRKEQEYDHPASVDIAMRQTDWPALCRLAASLRDDVPCVPLDHATNGLNNMARLLWFDDGVFWVARVALRRSRQGRNSSGRRARVDCMDVDFTLDAPNRHDY